MTKMKKQEIVERLKTLEYLMSLEYEDCIEEIGNILDSDFIKKDVSYASYNAYLLGYIKGEIKCILHPVTERN